MGKPGKREFVQVLRLLEVFRLEDVAAAVRRGNRARRDRLRCGQASGAVPDRAAAAAARSDDLSLPAQGDGGDDLGAHLYGPAGGSGIMSDTPQSPPSGPVPGVLLAYHLKALKLPTFLRVDLVSSRLMLFWLAGKQDLAIRRMVECLRRGGWLVNEDGDWGTIAPVDPSHPSVPSDRIHRGDWWTSRGYDPFFGRRLPILFERCG